MDRRKDPEHSAALKVIDMEWSFSMEGTPYFINAIFYMIYIVIYGDSRARSLRA
jgi:hypothetical protein